MFLAPALFFSVLEITLRVAGIGHPMSFFLPMKIGGKDYLVENERFGWRFLGPEMARTPFPIRIPKVKPLDTTRIFVFGESAALGDPQPEFSFGRILEALLEGRYPDRHFEVVNTGMTAINSHVILPIARDCARQHGDFWVIYMGNNEVVGPYGSGTVFGTQAPGLALVRASVALKGTYVGQLFERLLRGVESNASRQSEWGGMAMFARNHVRAEDPRMSTVYHNFERNLSDIIDAGLDAGATVIVSTVARNLRDCGPFASDHRPGFPEADLPPWTQFHQAGLAARQAGRLDEAIAAWQQADRLDDTFAEVHYRLGQCLLDTGRDADAARQFITACDQDTLRFRADSQINDIIRRVAAERRRKGVRFADSESAVNLHSPHALAGDEFLYEHVHLNFEGNYLVARTVAEQMEGGLSPSGKNPWPTEEECARRLGWNDFFRRAADLDIFARFGDAPFNTQADHQRQSERLLQQIEQLRSAVLPASVQAEITQTKAAAAAHPEDWVLLQNLSRLQAQAGDLAGAAESLRRITRVLPYNADLWQDLGLVLADSRDYDQAAAALQTSSRLRPESVASLNILAEMHAAAGQPEQAAREFREVLRRKPYWAAASFGLGKILDAAGQANEANANFDDAYQNRMRTPESLEGLADFAFGKGWYQRAVDCYTDALRLSPADPMIQYHFGLSLAKLGRVAEAGDHYREAIRLNPGFAEAYFCLGLESAQKADFAGAAAEFGEAVRCQPEFVEARVNLGIALAGEHLNEQALAQFEEVLRRDPNNPKARQFIGMLRASPPAAGKP